MAHAKLSVALLVLLVVAGGATAAHAAAADAAAAPGGLPGCQTREADCNGQLSASKTALAEAQVSERGRSVGANGGGLAWGGVGVVE